MAKTLIATLGVAGEDRPKPSSMTSLSIDGELTAGVYAVHIVMDASRHEPGKFCLHRVAIIDGLEFTAEETHVISNMSLIIEYQEGQ